jgi:hypothetical protein
LRVHANLPGKSNQFRIRNMLAASYFCFVRTQTPVKLNGVFPFVRSSIIYLIIPRIQKTFIIKGMERAVASRRMQSKRNKRRIKNIRK